MAGNSNFKVQYLCNENIIYNNSQYQNNYSVLCGYYCLYFINERNKGKTLYQIFKPFSLTNTLFNEEFIIYYFNLT